MSKRGQRFHISSGSRLNDKRKWERFFIIYDTYGKKRYETEYKTKQLANQALKKMKT